MDRQRERKGKHWSTLLSCDNQERNKIGFAALLNQGELISASICIDVYTHITNSVSIFKKWIQTSLLSQLLPVCRFTLALGKNTERLDIMGRQSRPRHLFFVFQYQGEFDSVLPQGKFSWSPLDPQDEHHGLFAAFLRICNFFSIAIFHTYNQDFVFLDGE